MPTRGDVTIEGWPGGINNVAKDTAVPSGFLRDALNVDLDNVGKPRRRSGRAKVVSGIGIHSLYASVCGPVYVEGSSLTKLQPDYSTAVLGDLTSPNRVSFDTIDDVTYLTNGYDIWKLSTAGALSSHGIPNPGGQPLLGFTSAFGSLQIGKYLVAVTFVGADGEESGASLAVEATLSQVGTLQLSGIPQSSDAAYVRIYVTEPGGEVLREHAQIAMGVTSYNISSSLMGRVLATQFMQRLPAGNFVRHFAGRLWVVKDNMVWPSEPLRYGLHSPADTFFEFREPVTVFEPAYDGIYVVADRTYFLAGSTPKEMRQIEIAEDRGVYGTGTTVHASLFDPQLTGEAAYWYSERGAVLGLPGGIIRNLMENTVAMPSYEEGATVVREQNGIRQAVTALRGSGADATFKIGDEISVTVKRNGIVI